MKVLCFTLILVAVSVMAQDPMPEESLKKCIEYMLGEFDADLSEGVNPQEEEVLKYMTEKFTERLNEINAAGRKRRDTMLLDDGIDEEEDNDLSEETDPAL